MHIMQTVIIKVLQTDLLFRQQNLCRIYHLWNLQIKIFGCRGLMVHQIKEQEECVIIIVYFQRKNWTFPRTNTGLFIANHVDIGKKQIIEDFMTV